MKIKIDFFRTVLNDLKVEDDTSLVDCRLTYSILHRLESELFTGRDIKLNINTYDGTADVVPPLIMINDEIFSQGKVLNTVKFIKRLGEMLHDDELSAEAVNYINYRKSLPDEPFNDEVVIYYSPTCPHCRALISYLEENKIQYIGKNIIDNGRDKEHFKKINPMLTIPLILHQGKMYRGFQKDVVDKIFNISTESITSSIPSDFKGPQIEISLLNKTIVEAKDLLKKNRVGDITKASSHLYPHQWSWDAAFISRGLLHYDCDAAYKELRSLFRGQWSDGFQPHIVFNDKFLGHFPGPEYWKAENSKKIPPGVHTSGISQPPVHASMLVASIDLDPDKKRAEKELTFLYEKIKAMHDFYFDHRQSKKHNLIYLVHPWESGLDNAPLWDSPLAEITEQSKWSRNMQKTYDELAKKGNRPARSYISTYSYLVESLFKRNYNWELIGREHKFQICDVLFNSVLCKSEDDLGTICRFIGKDPSMHHQRSKKLKDAINSLLWDENEGIYYDFDLVSEKYIKKDTVFSYLPLAGEICSKTQAKRLIGHLKSHCFCIADKDCMGIPSYDMCKIDYEGEFYWRGPIWFNMSWYVLQGLEKYGFDEDALWLRNSLYKLVMDNGFYEYYKPETGEGLGADGFSWTAALFLDLVSTEKTNK